MELKHEDASATIPLLSTSKWLDRTGRRLQDGSMELIIGIGAKKEHLSVRFGFYIALFVFLLLTMTMDFFDWVPPLVASCTTLPSLAPQLLCSSFHPRSKDGIDRQAFCLYHSTGWHSDCMPTHVSCLYLLLPCPVLFCSVSCSVYIPTYTYLCVCFSVWNKSSMRKERLK